LVHALSSDFDIGPCTFFCLALVHALYKNIGIGQSVNFLLKKKHKTNRVPRGPIISRHMAPIPIFLQSAGTNTNSFVFFFNRKLTEGPIPIFLQCAGTNFKQKKVQRPMSKYDESAETKDIFKHSF
jgi:hypothetical protein